MADEPDDLQAYLAKARLTAFSQYDRVTLYIQAYESLAIPVENIRILEDELPLTYDQIEDVLRHILKKGGDAKFALTRMAPEILLSGAIGLHRDELALQAAQLIERSTPADIRRAAANGMYDVAAVLAGRLSRELTFANADEVAAFDRTLQDVLEDYRDDEVTTLVLLMRRGHQLPDRDVGQLLIQKLDVDTSSGQDLLRILYQAGYAIDIPPRAQYLILAGPYSWLVLTHPEAWPYTAYALVRQAQRERDSLQTSLGLLLSPDLVRYIERAL